MAMHPVGARGGSQNYGMAVPGNFQDFMMMMFDCLGRAGPAMK